MRLRSLIQRSGTPNIESYQSSTSSSDVEYTPQRVSSHGASTSPLPLEQDNSLEGSSQRKKRGRIKEMLPISDPNKRIRLEVNKYNQPIGEMASKLSSVCGVVSRISTLCPITYNDWRHLLKDMKEPIVSYMKERFILSSKLESFALKTMGSTWSSYKSKLRQSIYKADAKGVSKSDIHANVPHGVEQAQWIQFVDYWLTEEAIEISKKHKKIREYHTQLHTTGSKSYARKRKEMEDAREREVGAVEFYRETHIKKNGEMEDDALDVLNQCNTLLSGRVLFPEDGDNIRSCDRIHLENEVMLEVQGPDHSGSVRGAGRGVTSTTLLDSKRLSVEEIQRFKAKIATLTKRNAELEKRDAELAKHDAEWMKREAALLRRGSERGKHVAELVKRDAERVKYVAELEKREAELAKRENEREKYVAELVEREAEREKQVAELVKREVEREKREAEREVEFDKLKQMLEAFMRR